MSLQWLHTRSSFELYHKDSREINRTPKCMSLTCVLLLLSDSLPSNSFSIHKIDLKFNIWTTKFLLFIPLNSLLSKLSHASRWFPVWEDKPKPLQCKALSSLPPPILLSLKLLLFVSPLFTRFLAKQILVGLKGFYLFLILVIWFFFSSTQCPLCSFQVFAQMPSFW